jgi:ring-1,2-phenylacetyl-CoA epoxidase subunit PaaC
VINSIATYALRLGDDALVLSHRLAQWSTWAPDLEEDIALTNIALDLLGQARALLSYAGEAEGMGRDEDDLAYLRDEREFFNCQLVEQPNDDFAVTIARQLYFSTYQLALYQQLDASADDTLRAVAAKATKEVIYHRDHATQWTLRLGDGTEESQRRMQRGLERMWPYSYELFEQDETNNRLVAQGIAVDPGPLRPEWERYVHAVLDEATLTMPEESSWRPTGGRQGLHSEALGHPLAEMQNLHRAHPGAKW